MGVMLSALGWIAVAIVLVAEAVIRFSHPGMTETQLLIAFWPTHVVAAGVGICLLFVKGQQ